MTRSHRLLQNGLTLVLTREDYNKSKPEPEPYSTALDLPAIEPDKVLVVDDSEKGIIAVKRAGLTCWTVPNRLSADGDFLKARDMIMLNSYEYLVPRFCGLYTRDLAKRPTPSTKTIY